MFCGQAGPKAVAGRTSVQAAFGTGGIQRSAPAVDSANGMPKNVATLEGPTVRAVPQTDPVFVTTAGVEQAVSVDVPKWTDPASAITVLPRIAASVNSARPVPMKSLTLIAGIK